MTLQTNPLLDEVASHGQACIDAIRHLTPAAPQNVEVLDSMYSMGFDALSAQKYQDAQVLFSYLVAQNPAKPDYLAGLGHALRGLGEAQTAALLHATAAGLNPNNAGNYLALADVLLELKDLEKAELVLAVAEASGASAPVLQKLQAKHQALKALMAHAV